MADQPCNLLTPGDVITAEVGFMRGHGTYLQDKMLYSSVGGVVERHNKLICVKPLKTRYNGEIGDVVIGRIVEVGQKRWKVETHARLDSVLQLSSVNLPGGELRRRCEKDEKMMRSYLNEGDLISAEVHQVSADGMLLLHTRSLKYGKLGQGVLVQVSPSLIKRRKSHFHNLPIGASIIFGNNGFIWISPTINEETDNTGGFDQNLEPVPYTDREVIIRLKNCVQALAESKMLLFDTSVLYAYEASSKYTIKDLLKPEVKNEITDLTIQRIELES